MRVMSGSAFNWKQTQKSVAMVLEYCRAHTWITGKEGARHWWPAKSRNEKYWSCGGERRCPHTHTHKKEKDGPYVRLLLYDWRRSGRPCFFFLLLLGSFSVCVVRCWNVVNAMTPSTHTHKKKPLSSIPERRCSRVINPFPSFPF